MMAPDSLLREMDAHEATWMVYSRVEAIDRENASKITGYLLLKDEAQIFRIAAGPDTLLQSAVSDAKLQLGLTQHKQYKPSPSSCPSFTGEVFPNDHLYPETFAFLNNSRIKAAKSATDWHPFEYSSCSSTSPVRSENAQLLELEMEIQELLSTRKQPVSIAALPQMYYERFGRPLQAQGYLTESQRHGKSGFNLTRLLSKLSDSITLIDRPHGQHAVVLAEEADKYTSAGPSSEHFDLNGVNPSSRQIYLTFPAESAFTEDDVNNHFRAYGPVQDVRIPYQQKRMFGFVTFVYPETVKIVLSEGNPHYICGARVLVKPYRERGHTRKHMEKSDSSKYMDLSTNSTEYPFFKLFEDENQSGVLEEQGIWSNVSPHSVFLEDQHPGQGDSVLLDALDAEHNRFKAKERSWSTVARAGLCKQEPFDKPN